MAMLSVFLFIVTVPLWIVTGYNVCGYFIDKLIDLDAI